MAPFKDVIFGPNPYHADFTRAKVLIGRSFSPRELEERFGTSSLEHCPLVGMVNMITEEYDMLNRLAKSEREAGGQNLQHNASSPEDVYKELVRTLKAQGLKGKELDVILSMFKSGETQWRSYQQSQLTTFQNQARALEGKLHEAEKQINSLDRQLEGAMRNVSKLESQIVNERREHSQLIQQIQKSHEVEMAQVMKQHNEELAQDKKQHDKEVAKLEKEKIQAEKRYKKDVISLNQVVYARDSFKPMANSGLREKFKSLANDIKHLGLRNWRSDQPYWSTELVKYVAVHPELMRRELLQDTIWWIVYEKLFCSPFRIFGEQGRAFETQWNEKYETGELFNKAETELIWAEIGSEDADYTWPKPSVPAEKYRYETIKSCQTALKEPASELDPRARLKKGFKESRDDLITAIEDAIEEVAKLDSAVSTEIEKFVKKAISVWLECCIQRCRIVVNMPESGMKSDEQRIRLVEGAGLTLLLAPKIVRYGDSEGLDLHKPPVDVPGCSFETQRYPNKSGEER